MTPSRRSDDPILCPQRLTVLSLLQAFGHADVLRVLSETGTAGRRRRDMPADVTLYFVVALGLFMHVSVREVLRCVLDGLRAVRGPTARRVTGKSGITQARRRLGVEPVRRLYDAHVGPVAAPDTRGAWFGRWRLVSLDGSTLDVPDTPANRRAFGGPTTFNDRSPFPQVRFVCLAEVGTRVLFGGQAGGYADSSEVGLARNVLPRLAPGMLCLADRGFFGFDLWRQAAATGAALLWRVPKSVRLPVDEALPDGSYRSRLDTWRNRCRTPPASRRPASPVRVVEYRLAGVAGRAERTYRLATTLLDPGEAPAAALADLYHQRWEVETAFDELKTHLRGPRLCLRSRTPELVRQEFYGLLLAHFAVRGLIHQASRKAGEDPDRLSFTHTLRVIRRKVSHPAPFSPRRPDAGA